MNAEAQAGVDWGGDAVRTATVYGGTSDAGDTNVAVDGGTSDAGDTDVAADLPTAAPSHDGGAGHEVTDARIALQRRRMEAKREYNRLNAALTRRRTKEHIEDLQTQLADFSSRNATLLALNAGLAHRIDALTRENVALRQWVRVKMASASSASWLEAMETDAAALAQRRAVAEALLGCGAVTGLPPGLVQQALGHSSLDSVVDRLTDVPGFAMAACMGRSTAPTADARLLLALLHQQQQQQNFQSQEDLEQRGKTRQGN